MGIGASKATKWVGGNYKRLVGRKLGRKGYVPVRVGMDEESCRRYMVEMEALRDEGFRELLLKSAHELGFRNDGILRILDEPCHFERRYILKSKHTPHRDRFYHHFFHKFTTLLNFNY